MKTYKNYRVVYEIAGVDHDNPAMRDEVEIVAKDAVTAFQYITQSKDFDCDRVISFVETGNVHVIS